MSATYQALVEPPDLQDLGTAIATAIQEGTVCVPVKPQPPTFWDFFGAVPVANQEPPVDPAYNIWRLVQPPKTNFTVPGDGLGEHCLSVFWQPFAVSQLGTKGG